ncbi:MAG TPA: hypothetical protein VFU69_05015 [Ktedonobacterales bacterium]|nr:hypothetical protein [Ktedonobacterales bacterium]
MKRLALRATAACFSLLLCFGILSACATVPIQTGSSATAPVITWVVTEVGVNTPHILGANAQFTIQPGAQYDVSMHAKTSSGVKTLTVTGGDDWTCISTGSGEPIGQNSTGDFAPQTVNQTAKNGQAQDELFSFQELGLPESPCNSGFTFSGGAIELNGTAANFANEQSTGHLVLTAPPSQ